MIFEIKKEKQKEFDNFRSKNMTVQNFREKRRIPKLRQKIIHFYGWEGIQFMANESLNEFVVVKDGKQGQK